TPFRPPVEVPDANYPLRLTTVRTADAWHTLTRTGKVASLRHGTDRALLSVHPDDAARSGVRDGDAVELLSRRGRWRGRAVFCDQVPPGTVSASFHWPSMRDARAVVNGVTPAALDPRSLQPELKHAAVRLVRAARLTRLVVIGAGAASALAAALRERGCEADAVPWTTSAPYDAEWCVVADESAPWEAWRRAARLPNPVFVDAGARIVGRHRGHAVGAPVFTAGGLPVTTDPERQADALLGDGAAGPRAIVNARLGVDDTASTFEAGATETAPDDAEQGIRRVTATDGTTGFRVTWRLAAGQALGVAATGPLASVERVARAWADDASPEELMHGSR
ncbi:MAG TPA: molybdopterin dinucleotide binding domain-containing protein, partial [Candidatus Dormibacteraeota bacterium]